MTTQDMTISRLNVKGDIGKFYLKRYFCKIVGLLAFFFLFIALTLCFSFNIEDKYGIESKEYDTFFYFILFSFFLSIIVITIIVKKANIKEYYIQYIFAIDSTSSIFVLNCLSPNILSIYKRSHNQERVKLGFYGKVFRIIPQTSCIVDNAKSISFCSYFDIVNYAFKCQGEDSSSAKIIKPILDVYNLKNHKKYISFSTIEQLNNCKRYKKKYKISKDFTHYEELIKVLENLNNLT